MQPLVPNTHSPTAEQEVTLSSLESMVSKHSICYGHPLNTTSLISHFWIDVFTYHVSIKVFLNTTRIPVCIDEPSWSLWECPRFWHNLSKNGYRMLAQNHKSKDEGHMLYSPLLTCDCGLLETFQRKKRLLESILPERWMTASFLFCPSNSSSWSKSSYILREVVDPYFSMSAMLRQHLVSEGL